jgi:hypothetical protein
VNSFLQEACRPIEEIIFPQNQGFDVCQNFWRKTNQKSFCKMQASVFIGLQIASFDYMSASVQLMQMPLLRRNSQINCFGTMPAKGKASGEKFLGKVIRRSCRTSDSDVLKGQSKS